MRHKGRKEGREREKHRTAKHPLIGASAEEIDAYVDGLRTPQQRTQFLKDLAKLVLIDKPKPILQRSDRR